jgi:uncharacterized RDD family membrane protein YckC
MQSQKPLDMLNNYPELKDRIQSTFFDTIFLLVLMFAFAAVIDKYENVPDWVRIAGFIGLFFVYEPLFTTLGCTLGNYFKGIRVRKVSDTSKKINFLQALIRYPIKLFLGWISFLTISSNPQRRAMHDLAAGTVMIKLENTDAPVGVE